ncbi:MAG: hypothetical protein GF418_03075, partial [Chitinivibrionales bacterium]|nr:hypothetical protein [Chitinivibrionales bacterium]MBD3394585.1 hypothetical protein [Chitinivibrionales bacterium]
MPKRKDTGKDKKTHERKFEYGHEFWGVVFFAVAFLLSLSLISNLVNPGENLLGPYARALAVGLRRLFGTLPSFLFPLAVFNISYVLFRGRTVRNRSLVVWTCLVFETCVLLAIANLPTIREADSLSPNIVGNAVVYLLYFLFGPHRFGPYFLIVFALLLTFAAAVNLNVRHAIVLAGKSIAAASAWVWKNAASLWTSLSAKKERPLPAGREAAEPQAQAALRGRVRKAVETAASQPAAVEGNGVEEEAQRLLEEELAKFREKRNEPVKITTGETDAAPENDGREEEPEDAPQEDLELKKAAREAEVKPDDGPDTEDSKGEPEKHEEEWEEDSSGEDDGEE